LIENVLFDFRKLASTFLGGSVIHIGLRQTVPVVNPPFAESTVPVVEHQWLFNCNFGQPSYFHHPSVESFSELSDNCTMSNGLHSISSQISKKLTLGLVLACSVVIYGCTSLPPAKDKAKDVKFPSEVYFKSVLPLTSGGQNRGARWSSDGDWIAFKRSEGQTSRVCSAVYLKKMRDSELKTVPTGKGPILDTAFLPNGQRVLFSALPTSEAICPDLMKPMLDTLPGNAQIFGVKPNGEDVIAAEPGAPSVFNSQIATCKNNSAVFTSTRDGDIQLFGAVIDSSFGTLGKVHRLTRYLGYDGMASFSPDCTKIVWLASRPSSDREIRKFKKLASQRRIDPKTLNIWIADSDGSNAQQVTHTQGSVLNPVFTPDGGYILFSSNLKDPQSDQYGLYRVKLDGSDLKQVTESSGFDVDPSFSPDGKYLVFSSSRGAKFPDEINLFLAEWLEPQVSQADISDNSKGSSEENQPKWNSRLSWS